MNKIIIVLGYLLKSLFTKFILTPLLNEVIMEKGGPTGPFTKAIVDAVESKDSQKESTKHKKVIIQFKK